MNKNSRFTLCMANVRQALLIATMMLFSAGIPAQADESSASQMSTISIRPYADGQKPFEGWGVSLCWWANVCGTWSEERVDSLVDWLVSPHGLNFRIFRYNIGGGEDPYNRHCTLHHMGKGKGLRAEMEGFKDSTNDVWHWERDAAQRRIMLKIRDRRPDAIFEAFSNSAPYYMTVSGCCGGHQDAWKDNLRPECYEEFAHYLVDVCKHYKECYGIEFRTLDPFNEPMTNYWYAGGSQEGCHFDFSSQIAFIKVLYPILRASGLKTVISAADETSVMTSVKGFYAYEQAGVLPLVGQWNTHTYDATDEARSQLYKLCREYGMHLWMSETGASGKGLDGNLGMAERLIQDIRLMRPAAWVDWQYMEDNNDQWCLVKGDFYNGTQKFHKVKNYYVRQHFSRFIPQGYTMLETDSKHLLAAMSPDADTLVAVCVNRGNHDLTFQLDVSKNICRKVKLKKAKAYLTTSVLDLAPMSRSFLTSGCNGRPQCTLPSGSITTLVVPMKAAR
ncbi:MAG: glycoside hydrolase [Bacteroidaceae bacterium]